MRKYLFLVLAILLVCGVAVAATPGYRTSPGAGDVLGGNAYQETPGKIFRMVRYIPATYSGAATLPADSMVIWDLTNDDGVTVTTSTTSSDSAVAGILVTASLTPDTDGNTAAQDVGKGNWTWLQTYGLSQVDNTLIVVTAGDAMGTSTTAGEANPHQGSVNNARAQGIAGFFYDSAAAAAEDVECFLNID